jgi:hypothetical protein
VTRSVKWTDEATATYNKLRQAAATAHRNRRRREVTKSSKQEGLFKQVDETVRLLAANPRHPGLRTHEFHSLPHPFSEDEKVFEAYAQHRTPGAHRVFWCYGPGKRELTIIAITPHP